MPPNARFADIRRYCFPLMRSASLSLFMEANDLMILSDAILFYRKPPKAYIVFSRPKSLMSGKKHIDLLTYPWLFVVTQRCYSATKWQRR